MVTAECFGCMLRVGVAVVIFGEFFLIWSSICKYGLAGFCLSQPSKACRQKEEKKYVQIFYVHLVLKESYESFQKWKAQKHTFLLPDIFFLSSPLKLQQ